MEKHKKCKKQKHQKRCTSPKKKQNMKEQSTLQKLKAKQITSPKNF